MSVKRSEKDALYVQYGCGMCAPQEWKNFDILRFKRLPLLNDFLPQRICAFIYHHWKDPMFPANVEFGDIVRGLPIPDNSCKGLYCSHLLHQFALDDFRTVLKNSYRVLQPGGIFRQVMPDLEYLVHKYLDDPSPDAMYRFMRSSCFGYETYPKSLKSLLKGYLTQSYWARRKWMWDFKGLAIELRDAGFRDIRIAEIGDSGDPMFDLVEDPARWGEAPAERTGWWEKGLGIHCRK